MLFLFPLYASDATAGSVSVEELSKMIEKKESFLLLDLRMPSDYMNKHIDGAVNADLSSAVLQGDYDTSKKILTSVLKEETGNEKGEGKTIVLACYTGNRYARAAVKILSEMGRDLSNVYILTGGNTAWDAYEKKQNEVKEEPSPVLTAYYPYYAWGDTFSFEKKVGKCDFDLYSALDIMGINTSCAFESNAADVGLAGSYANKEIRSLNGDTTVKEVESGLYLLSFPKNITAMAERRWPQKTTLTSFLPTPKNESGIWGI